MKIKSLIIAVALLSVLSPQFGAAQKGQVGKPASQQKSAIREGLFTVEQKDADWFFGISDSLIGRRFLISTRYTATPASTGQYGGESVNQQMVYWQPTPDGKRLLLRSEVLINAADSVDNINRAILVSNENPIIGSFPIERGKDSYRIKVTQFLADDNPAIGLPINVKSSWGLQGYMPQESYVESIKTFPQNTEIRLVKTWFSTTRQIPASANTGRVTVGINISFVLLPKEPMQRRLFDPRVGYFSDQFNYYADNQQRVDRKRFITRWRLEPKDSADRARMERGELVEPKKPIVYYIDPATPKQWRPYLIQGVNDWQKAFERAGFKNAIIGREWPENDSTMSMEDARYSVIRYLASPTPNAYGPHIHDPRSGEILESHICWYHNVMTLVHDWYMIQAGSIDEAARCMKYDEELMGQLIRFVSSHEVGHTLGLRHNFGSSSTVPVDSLRSKAWVEANGHTPSIMDYARFNYVAQPEDSISRAGIFPRINDYDLWAIEWGYRPMPGAYDDVSDHWELERLTSERLKNQPRLWFGDGETNRTNDSRCQTEDLGDDAMKAGEYGILNLKRMLRHLPEWTYESGDIYGNNLQSMYKQVISQFQRYTGHVLANLGGVLYDYKTVDQSGDVYTNVPRAHQERAFAFLRRHILTEPRWFIDQNYIRRLAPDPQTISINIGLNSFARMTSPYVLDRLTTEYPATDYLKDIEQEVFRTLSSGERPSPYTQALQERFVAALCDYYKSSNVHADARPAVLETLIRLRARLRAARSTDTTLVAHYRALADTIRRTLDVD